MSTPLTEIEKLKNIIEAQNSRIHQLEARVKKVFDHHAEHINVLQKTSVAQHDLLIALQNMLLALDRMLNFKGLL